MAGRDRHSFLRPAIAGILAFAVACGPATSRADDPTHAGEQRLLAGVYDFKVLPPGPAVEGVLVVRGRADGELEGIVAITGGARYDIRHIRRSGSTYHVRSEGIYLTVQVRQGSLLGAFAYEGNCRTIQIPAPRTSPDEPPSYDSVTRCDRLWADATITPRTH